MQLIEHAKMEEKDIIFVTDDNKEDWWQKVHGEKMGARFELRKEFYQQTGQDVLIISMESFLRIQKITNEDILKEIKRKISNNDLSKEQLMDIMLLENNAAEHIRKIMSLKENIKNREMTIKGILSKYSNDKIPNSVRYQLENTMQNISQLESELEIEEHSVNDINNMIINVSRGLGVG